MNSPSVPLPENIFKIFEPTITEKHITAVTKISPGLPQLFSDNNHFARILGHLVSNAVKFTGNGGSIEISAMVDGFGELRIDVSDSGIGMSQDDYDMAMAPFGRLHSSSGHDPFGVGLGLPLAGKFARLLGGKLSLESHLGAGTRVQLRFHHDAVFRDFPLQQAG